MMSRKQYTLKSVHKFYLNINPLNISSMNKEELTPDQKKSWSTVLKFVVEVVKLIIASFLGGSASTLIS